MNTDGTNVQQLTVDSMQAGDSNWSPDGAKITFVDNFCICPFNSDVFTMNADGSGVTQLTSNFGNDLEPMYSPDGTEITFAHFANLPNGDISPNGDVLVVNSGDGSGVTNLTRSPNIDDETPDWGRAPAAP
jgi:Tol biopolymer transport system component